jgi:hypothetical protein
MGLRRSPPLVISGGKSGVGRHRQMRQPPEDDAGVHTNGPLRGVPYRPIAAAPFIL